MLSFYFNSSECTYKFVLREELIIRSYCLSELWFLFIERKRGVVKLVFGCRENIIFGQPSLVEDTTSPAWNIPINILVRL